MSAKIIRSICLMGMSIAICSCSLVKPPQTSKPLETVELKDVLNKVKDEINAYRNMQLKKNVPIKGLCYKNDEPMALVPAHIVVTLKTVATHEYDASSGVVNPIGILKINPTVEYDSTVGRTQTITMGFDVADTPIQATSPGTHDLANAIAAIRDGIARVDHNEGPCIQFGTEDEQKKKPPIQLSVQFEAKRDTTAALGFNLVVLKLSDKEKISSDFVQTIAIDLVSTQEQALRASLQ